jgi:hypothetical protein
MRSEVGLRCITGKAGTLRKLYSEILVEAANGLSVVENLQNGALMRCRR